MSHIRIEYCIIYGLYKLFGYKMSKLGRRIVTLASFCLALSICFLKLRCPSNISPKYFACVFVLMFWALFLKTQLFGDFVLHERNKVISTFATFKDILFGLNKCVTLDILILIILLMSETEFHTESLRCQQSGIFLKKWLPCIYRWYRIKLVLAPKLILEELHVSSKTVLSLYHLLIHMGIYCLTSFKPHKWYSTNAVNSSFEINML